MQQICPFNPKTAAKTGEFKDYFKNTNLRPF